MKHTKIPHLFILLFLATAIFNSCGQNTHQKINDSEFDDKDAANAKLLSADSLEQYPFLKDRYNKINEALQMPRPVLLCSDSLNEQQKMAQIIALNDTLFTQFLFDPFSKQPYRNEIFGVYPARQSDMSSVKENYNLPSVFRIEMYNYALNNTSIALVDIQQKKVLNRYFLSQTQPDISNYLRNLAVKIAVESPEVQNAMGIKPNEAAALMASTLTSLN